MRVRAKQTSRGNLEPGGGAVDGRRKQLSLLVPDSDDTSPCALWSPEREIFFRVSRIESARVQIESERKSAAHARAVQIVFLRASEREKDDPAHPHPTRCSPSHYRFRSLPSESEREGERETTREAQR